MISDIHLLKFSLFAYLSMHPSIMYSVLAAIISSGQSVVHKRLRIYDAEEIIIKGSMISYWYYSVK